MGLAFEGKRVDSILQGSVRDCGVGGALGEPWKDVH